MDEEYENETPSQYLRRVGSFKFACACFEFQFPSFVWSNRLLAHLAHHLHDLFCLDMWLIRVNRF
jgi:hypothetical protein